MQRGKNVGDVFLRHSVNAFAGGRPLEESFYSRHDIPISIDSNKVSLYPPF